ncbi:Pca regulon regulatory protein [Pigmentiphaga humi]|uniref:Pca regulon regulatory protein n=1 Tax=Pigmentiphaga humi TaxID=2478468 RepID=A0A3P4B7I0_9BURK|nr:DNA-binding transcriptional regulator [Pigmentiphaga humi]VCU71901.1 Pca regulon regulatory protein [Pigmentiphaga humi]
MPTERNEHRGESPYKEVRGLSRGIDVLKAMNACPGGFSTVSELARRTGIHRTTVKRLLETLRAHGLVTQEDEEGRYTLGHDLLRLTEGIQQRGWIKQVASPLMHASIRKLLWPSDLAVSEAGFMVVRESTHSSSLLSQHRAMVGERLPMLVTAIGRAYLAACSDSEIQAIVQVLSRRRDALGELARTKDYVRNVIRETRRRGYGVNSGDWTMQPSIAAIAVPVASGERLLGAINLIYPIGALGAAEIRQRFLPALKELAASIGEASSAWLD